METEGAQWITMMMERLEKLERSKDWIPLMVEDSEYIYIKDCCVEYRIDEYRVKFRGCMTFAVKYAWGMYAIKYEQDGTITHLPKCPRFPEYVIIARIPSHLLCNSTHYFPIILSNRCDGSHKNVFCTMTHGVISVKFNDLRNSCSYWNNSKIYLDQKLSNTVTS